MKLVSTDEMRELERRAGQEGLSIEALMERAGLAVAKGVRDWLGGVARLHICILVGPGNNGGDGLVAATHLHDWGARVSLCICGRRVEGDALYQRALERGISSLDAGAGSAMTLLQDWLASTHVVIDALLGTGSARPISGAMAQVLEAVKESKARHPDMQIVALDLPSGLDADSGKLDPASLKADLTITLGYPKLGLFALPAAEAVGKLIIEDIGIPERLAQDLPRELITADWVKTLLPKRPLWAHKGSFGKLLVVAGSTNYIGAACLACTAAYRVGAGLVTLASARSLHPIFAAKLNETTFLPLPEAEPGVLGAEALSLLSEVLPGYDALLMGCGLGQHRATQELVVGVLRFLPSSLRIILDADALNVLAQVREWWHGVAAEAVLTPHPGEMARLTGLGAAEVESKRLPLAQEQARQWHQTTVLKGAYTVVASPEGKAAISPVANPALASAGTGDVLAGAIGGLLAQGLAPFEAGVAGVYLHAQAGERVRRELGPAGLLAGDLLPQLPLAAKELRP